MSGKTHNGPRNGTMSGEFNKVQSMPRHWPNLKSTLEVELKCTLEQKFLEIFKKSCPNHANFQHQIYWYENQLTLNGILLGWWGCYHPPYHRKIHEKKSANAIKVLWNWKTFKTIFETSVSSWRLSRDHYWGGGIHEIHNFRGFLKIS